jgi:hypothetical protein
MNEGQKKRKIKVLIIKFTYTRSRLKMSFTMEQKSKLCMESLDATDALNSHIIQIKFLMTTWQSKYWKMYNAAMAAKNDAITEANLRIHELEEELVKTEQARLDLVQDAEMKSILDRLMDPNEDDEDDLRDKDMSAEEKREEYSRWERYLM